MRLLYLACVWLHILAAMLWIGGMLFLVTVIVPMLRRPEMRAKALELFHVLGVRFRRVGWFAITTLILTGIGNLLLRGFTLSQIVDGEVFAGPWGHTLALKLIFVLVLVASSAVHDFYVGPSATRLARENAPPQRREAFRRAASWMGRASLLLALAIVALAVALVR
jgi:uncharacterized membrane protein